MKNFAGLLLILLLAGCSAPINQEKENSYGESILVGPVNWDGMTAPPYSEWFIPNYRDYKVDETSLALIEPVINEIDITVFLGSWCEDSQVQIPQFYRMMDHLGYDISRINIIALERLESGELVGPDEEELGYNIGFVPTFVFYKEGAELGRIVEYPKRTIEKDMVEILLGE